MNNDYLSVVGFLIFTGFIGTLGLLAKHVQRLKDEEAEKNRRESLEKH